MLSKYRQNLRVIGNKVYSYDTHVATIQGGQLVRLGWWSVTTSKHINYVAREYGLEIVDLKKEKQDDKQDGLGGQLKAVAMVSAFGDLLCDTPKARNDWKKRMLSTVHGISFPEDFDTLPEEERTRRLDEALKVISPAHA